MLRVENVTKYYGDLLAVDNLTFEVKPGEIFGLLGSNGAGKTTTFRIIMGLLDATSGNVYLDDKKIDYFVTDKIGYVSEERSLMQKLTVFEQMIFYGTLKSMTNKQIEEKLDYWLNMFQIPDYKHRKIKELSKGNQQKIQFITAVLNDPKLLVLDEPFTGLDPINVQLFNDALQELRKEGCIIIFSSHQMEFIEQFCEKLIILVDGKSVINGNIKKIKKDFKRKNIIVSRSFKKSELDNIKGIVSIKTTPREFIINVEDTNVSKDIFNVIKKFDIEKYVIEEPTLNEIFIDKVGETYEK